MYNNKALENVQKLYYLKTCAQGKSKAAIENIIISDSNYLQSLVMN